jgi:hypothetical protein
VSIEELKHNIEAIKKYCDDNIFNITYIQYDTNGIKLMGNTMSIKTYPLQQILLELDYLHNKINLFVYINNKYDNSYYQTNKKLRRYIYTLIRETKIKEMLQ